jgi:NAD(P)-dependent dehydrogenase (short-subunit alcohol dehydrogenase family)
MSFPPVPRSVLVTGCSSGIGLATAEMLAARGWRVFATARAPEDLAMLATKGLEPVELDVSRSESVQRAAALVLERSGGALGALVNNAGVGQPGALEDLDRDALRQQFEVNVFGLQELTTALIPAWRRQGSGRIVNVSSVLGRVVMPFMGAYCASKFAVEALSDALRVELTDSGIAVSIIEPGPIITAFRSNALEKAERHVDAARSRFGGMFVRELERRRTRVKKPGFWNKPPEAVARKIVHALEAPCPHRRYCVTPGAHAGAWLSRLAPHALLDAILSARVRRLQRG